MIPEWGLDRDPWSNLKQQLDMGLDDCKTSQED